MDFPGEVKITTLLAENNPTFRGILQDSLKTYFPSMTILEAEESSEALQIVNACQPELIFMDLQLPGENGLQITKKVKTNYPNISVIIVTGHDILEYREAAIQCGATCFFSKDSLNWREIETLIRSLNSNF